MKIVLLADDIQWKEMQSFISSQWLRVGDEQEFINTTDASVYINLLTNAASLDYSGISKTVIINSVSKTLKEIKASSNVVRINGWPTFLDRMIWELAGDVSEDLSFFFAALGKKIILTPDEPGLLSGRVVSMIVNEAYFALEQDVSTKPEIDIAMKMGTNYPFGPFEWSEKIGLNNIAGLLKKLAEVNKRYLPSLLLIQETELHANNLKH